MCALCLASVVVLATVLTDGTSYTLHLEFENAGRIVNGGAVQIAGRRVGRVTNVGLSPNGLAVITISVDASNVIPLRQGTRAAIRTVGAATIANNFVDIRPGPSNRPALSNGATLGIEQTSGIVDIDALLGALTPPVRASISRLISHSAQVFAGSGARDFNEMLAQLDPALAQIDGLMTQLSSDRADLAGLVDTADTAARALASRDVALHASVGDVAAALGAVAQQQRPLADALDRAGAVLDHGGGTLRDLTTAVTALRPTLRLIPPVSSPLARFLTLGAPVIDRTATTARQLRAELPELTQSLGGFSRLAPVADRGLRATGTALADAKHIMRGVRLYGSDFVLGLFNGLFAITAGNYNQSGHYIHAEFAQSPTLLPGGILASALPNLSGLSALSPSLFAIKARQTARCPGGANPPAPDGSSPWIADPSLCKPLEDVPASVDGP
jgi:virulence factor Mce-like protein